MDRIRSNAPAAPQTGTSLLEVLAAVAILGAGLLGLATSQAQSLDGLQQAHWQLQARLLAVEMIERYRAAGPHGVSSGARRAWRERLAARLPAARADIRWPAAAGGSGRIRLQWSDRAGGGPARLVLRFGP